MNINNVKSIVERFVFDEEGASALEYAILAAMIIAVLVLTIAALGGKTQGLFQRVIDIWDTIGGT